MIKQVVRLLGEVRARRAVHFVLVHSKGHSQFWGSDRADLKGLADLLADWGKCDVPYSWIRAGGVSEGDGARSRSCTVLTFFVLDLRTVCSS